MNNLKSLLNYLRTMSSIAIVPSEDYDDDEDLYDAHENLLCQACFDEIAVSSCPNCGCPLCFECYVKHVGKNKKKPLPN